MDIPLEVLIFSIYIGRLFLSLVLFSIAVFTCSDEISTLPDEFSGGFEYDGIENAWPENELFDTSYCWPEGVGATSFIASLLPNDCVDIKITVAITEMIM